MLFIYLQLKNLNIIYSPSSCENVGEEYLLHIIRASIWIDHFGNYFLGLLNELLQASKSGDSRSSGKVLSICTLLPSSREIEILLCLEYLFLYER